MKHALLVDDDAVFTRLLAAALERRGLAVHTAADGAHALAAAHAYAPDAVVLDLRLAGRSGLDVLPALRARLPRARIVLLTGYASIATAVQATRLGADAYLPKPVTADELLAALAGAAALPEQPRPLTLRALEWEHIQRVLAEHAGNVSAAARALGMHRRVLQRKLAKRAPPRPRGV
jgi:two-component system, response regulator RegA